MPKIMTESEIKQITIVCGAKGRIKTFLEANVQAIEEDREEKINLYSLA